MNAIHPGTLAEERLGGEKQQKTGAGGPLHVGNFTLLFGGQTISVMGDALYLVALPWLVLTTGGSAQELGIVLAAYGIPRALSMLVGGWLSDRLGEHHGACVSHGMRNGLEGTNGILPSSNRTNQGQFCPYTLVF